MINYNRLNNMSDFLNTVWPNKPYTLSLEKDELKLVIPKDVLKLCGKQDMFVLDFLHRSYKKNLNGVILNVEEDLNPELQVSTYLGALNNALHSTFLGLILCPDDGIIKWHYYMSSCGISKVKLLAPETALEEIEDDSGMIFLVSFSDIKLIESLMEYDFLSVVIDRFDEVATKRIIRKLQSNFNIGITYRNFYTEPDQKLQWTMLNWSNPGCVGKLIDFYETDNDNFVNFRDAYKEWWFRITWNYCDSFIKPTLTEKGNLNIKLRDWAKKQNLFKYSLKQNEQVRKARKRTVQTQNESGEKPKRTKRVCNKSIKNKKINKDDVKNELSTIQNKQAVSDSEDSDTDIVNIPSRMKRVYNKTTKNKSKISYTKNSVKTEANISDSTDSGDTIIYGNFQGSENQKTLPDDNIKEAEKSPSEDAINFNDNASMSSGEQLFFSLINDNSSTLQNKRNNDFNQTCNANVEDECDIFLKSVATKDEFLIQKVRGTEHLLSEETPKSRSLPSIDRELLDIAVESDNFLKNICSGKSMEENSANSSNYTRTSSTISEVDSLVAEVMEMVRN